MPRQRKPRRDSDRCAIVNRTVSFNMDDPFQLSLLEYTDGWVNFSGGIKRLLAAQLNSGVTLEVPSQTVSPPQISPSLTISAVNDDEWDGIAGLL